MSLKKYGADDIDAKIVGFTEYCIKWVIRLLALVIVVVIVFSAVDIIILIVSKLRVAPNYVVGIDHVVDILGAFLTVLIAVEVYQNIVLYLREDIIQVKVVLATAVIAVSRKVIVMDLSNSQPLNILALAGIVLAVAIAYWLVRSERRVSKKVLSEQGNTGNTE